MKKNLLLLLLLSCSFLTSKAFTHHLVVKGYVKDSTGLLLANKAVRIFSTDSSSGCLVSHTVYTNPNGYYIDTVTCNEPVRKLLLVVEDCRGARILREVTATNGSSVIEENFKICAAAPAISCKAFFSDSITANGIRFMSKLSAAPAGDSIISRTWYFGDTSGPLTGNRIDPVHLYAKPGVYNVCLAIKTRNGCESKFCTSVTIKDTIPGTACKAQFNYSYKDSVVYFNSAASYAPPGDSIISRTWYYIDSTNTTGNLVLQGNVVDTFIRYTVPGHYTVYLVIKTKKGCESKTAVTVVIPPQPVPCTLQPKVSIAEKIGARKFRFSSSGSTAAGDSIVMRKWSFGDGTGMDGNETSPLKEYKDTGVYNVCVRIKTGKGCEKEYCITVVVKDSSSNTPPTGCKAIFNYTVQDRTVKFNSSASAGATPQDSIISRTWLFGDSTQALTGSVDPAHTYAKNGTYTVYLYIKTKNGCESKYTAIVTAGTAGTNCQATVQFTATRISQRKVQFNSLPAGAAGDSIVQRKWKFGDGSVLAGNEANPVKEYPFQGIYTACLTIRTAKGCEAEACRQITVQDTSGLNESVVNFVKIVSLNPNPVVTRMLATVWSRNANTEAEITILDIYGVAKLTLKKTLGQGNNIIEMPVANLYRGPYFLRLTTRGSRDSKMFYKL